MICYVMIYTWYTACQLWCYSYKPISTPIFRGAGVAYVCDHQLVCVSKILFPQRLTWKSQISRGPLYPLYSCMEDHQGSWMIIKQDDYILQMRVCQVNVFPKNAASSSCSLNSNALEFRWRNRWALHQPLHLSPRIPTGYRVCVSDVCVYNYI